jgi:hypothetical protein
MSKLTTIEKRAKNFCSIIAQDKNVTFTVEWIYSKMGGSNPRIVRCGDKITNVSGSGYCKLSQCLADALQFLGEGIAQTGGAGENSVISALAKIGWNLERVASGKTFDVFTIKSEELT